MSRVGKVPVPIPSGVTTTLEGRNISVTGPKGSLQLVHPPRVTVAQDGDQLVVSKKGDSRAASEQYGLTRTLIANMVRGVSEGYERNLEIKGVGYRAQVSGNKITLNLGFSHPIEYQLPEGVEAKVEGNLLTLTGIDKQKLGQAAAQLRALRKPEPYKGKGIKYQEERIRRKAGKTATK